MKKVLYSFISVSSIIVLFSGCYYDNMQDLYPLSYICDTTNVTYNAGIKQILDANCVRCHSQSNAANGIALDTYTSSKTCAQSGRMFGAVNHESGYSAMPQQAAKMGDCEISSINIWIRNSMPE